VGHRAMAAVGAQAEDLSAGLEVAGGRVVESVPLQRAFGLETETESLNLAAES